MTFCQSVSVYFFSTVYHIINWKSRAINYKLKQLTLLLSRDEIICKVDISLSSFLSYSSNKNGPTFYTVYKKSSGNNFKLKANSQTSFSQFKQSLVLATCLCSYNIFSSFLALALMLLCNDANGLLRVSVVQHSDNCSIINILFSMCYFVSSLRIYHVATFVCRGNSNITQ